MGIISPSDPMWGARISKPVTFEPFEPSSLSAIWTLFVTFKPFKPFGLFVHHRK